MKIIRWIVLLSAFPILAVSAQGTKPAAGQAAAEWNPIKGEKAAALLRTGDPKRGEEAFAVCRGCHQDDAAGSASGVYPRLAGQHATVLIEQIADVRSGVRANPKMAPFVSAHIVTTQDIADIATYLAALPVTPNRGQGPGNALPRGQELYTRDCASCHGQRGEGDAKQFYPLVAGQHYKYLLRQARAVRDGTRGNANPEMAAVIKRYKDADLQAVSDFISRMPPP